MTLITISKPSQAQIKHGLERVVATFYLGSFAYMASHHWLLNTSVLHGALYAGAMAVYQLGVSLFTETL